MIPKAVKRKISEFWKHQCACCGAVDFLEFHHIIPKAKGGSDEFDNVLLLCASCHAKIHGRSFDPNRPNCKTSVDYETAKTVLEKYFNEEIGAHETKELLNLSQKTHLSESALYKRYKRENGIGHFYNHVDLLESQRRKSNVSNIKNDNV